MSAGAQILRLAGLLLLVVLLNACIVNQRTVSETMVLPATETPTAEEQPAQPESPSSAGGEIETVRPAATEAASSASEGSEAAATAFFAQADALLPSAQDDLAELESIPHYGLKLSVNPDNLEFSGELQLRYTNTEDASLDRLYFRLLPNGQASYGNGALVVDQLTYDGAALDYQLSLNDTVMEITLPEALPPGETTHLQMVFSGRIPRDFGGQAEPSGYGIFNYSEGVLALSGWYPILAVYDDQGWNLDPVSHIGDSVYSDMAFYSVELEAPAENVVAATGVTIDQRLEGQTAIWQLASGPSRDFFIVMSPDFESVSQEVDGTQVNSYYLPGHEQAAQYGLEIASISLDTFNERFGIYPYEELDLVEAPMRNALGVEYPGIILVARQLYEDPENPSFVVATAHEVAHQWWYNVIGNDVFDEPWLDEALTTYSSSLYYEAIGGPGAAQGLIAFWNNRFAQLQAEGGDEPVTESLSYFENLPNPGSYGGVVYTKGGLFFVALRAEIGDQAFFDALQDYYQSQKYQIADAEDLLSAFEQASGRELDDFYEEWLYSVGP